jgi:hypothetical protein
VACSLANLCLLKIWSLVLEGGVSLQRNVYVAALANLALLTAAIWPALRLSRRRGGPGLALRGLLAVLFLVALHGLLTIVFLNATDLRLRNVAYVAAAALALAVLASRAMAIRLLQVLLAASPFVLMTVSQAGWRMATARPPAEAPAPQPRVAMKAGAPRVVWILFDTWDYGLSYPDRDPSLRLPELDRLRSEALFSENATSPGPETALSVPVMLGNTERTMGAVPNLFSRVHERGFNIGVAGWFFPYCDEFRASLEWCAAWERSTDRNSMGSGVLEIMRSQAKIALEAEFRSPFGQLLATTAHARVYRQWAPAAEQAVSDAGLSLVFVHAPVPHEPFFYDRFTGRDDLWDTFLGGIRGLKYDRFLDALELMDRTFGGFRRAMERSGTWETSAVIATSDHPYAMRRKVDGRPVNPRVPFLVKLPGQREGLRYAGHFETAHTGDLILAILNGEIARSEDLVRWMEEHGGQGRL